MMMFSIEMLCKIVCQIFFSWVPCHIKVFPSNLVGYPEEVLFHSSRPLFLDSVICDGSGCAVVTMDWRCGLFVPQFLKCEAQDGCVLTVVEERAKFGLSRGCDDEFADVGADVDGAI